MLDLSIVEASTFKVITIAAFPIWILTKLLLQQQQQQQNLRKKQIHIKITLVYVQTSPSCYNGRLNNYNQGVDILRVLQRLWLG